MSIGLSFWLAKRSSDAWTRINARRDIRDRLRRQTMSFPKGKGNKAWKRVKIEIERMRSEGWVTLEELLGGLP